MTAGRIVRFTKEGAFAAADDGSIITDADDYVALCDETQVGWIKFNGLGQAPDRVMGLLYDGFVLPPRESLGDTDMTQWDEGLTGKPEDPWQHQINVVLQKRDTGEMFCFSTSSNTGRRAVGNLLRHYDRMRRAGGNDVPVVRLKVGGFQHKDSRVGWVKVPTFVVVGRVSRRQRPQAKRTSTGPAQRPALVLGGRGTGPLGATPPPLAVPNFKEGLMQCCDKRFFNEHPDRTYRVRLVFPEEAAARGHGQPVPDDCLFYAFVMNVSPGVVSKVIVGLVDGTIPTQDFPEDLCKVWYERAVSEVAGPIGVVH